MFSCRACLFFNIYVLLDPECASVFSSYKSDIKILTTNYFGSGLAFAGLSLEEECYENSKNFLYVTYTPYTSSNNTQYNTQNNTQTSVSLDEQVYRFLEQKNGTQWNILVLDEALDSSLDDEGIESLLGVILKEFSNKNIVLVSHNEEIKNMDIFNRKVTISKNNFSSISFESLADSISKM